MRPHAQSKLRSCWMGGFTLLAALACSPIQASAAQCGNSSAGFEAWKQQFAGEARAHGIGAAGVAALMQTQYNSATIAADRGIFLPVTWRLAPAVSAFTSEVFYEGKLKSRPTLERQRLVDAGRLALGWSVYRDGLQAALSVRCGDGGP